jgi:hypothetical protein
MFPKIQIKRDPALLAFAAVLTVAGFVGLGFHLLTWKELGGFLLAAFAMPGLFGRSPIPESLDSSPPSPLPRITYDEDEEDEDEPAPDTERTRS